ncbi:MAG: hypothetical protein ABWK15_04210 [Dissulfuribacterales bacterium]
MKKTSIFLTLTMSVFLLSSCAQFGPGAGANDASPVSSQAVLAMPDVPAPVELKKDEDKSMVIRTNDFEGGFLVMRGKLTVSSLIDFYTNTMPQYGWNLKGVMHAKQNLIAFSKPNGDYCLINISEANFGYDTEVQFWVITNKTAGASRY